jgi:phosphomannomutase
MHYIFDVDGTLTPSRGVINSDFKEWFLDFMKLNPVYFVTGSDKKKTLEQVGTRVYNEAKIVYNCSGNDVWKGNKNIRSGVFHLPSEVEQDLLQILKDSRFYEKTGFHIDARPGLVNFSIVGRNCTLEQRVMYKQWDEHKNERREISEVLSEKYPSLRFEVAGETGIDITPAGSDKSQILVDFEDEVMFFGDKTMPGGNDYTIAQAIIERGGVVHTVNSWEDTWKILKAL